jgi:hypothetical protein
MITATAKSITLPRMANSLNSFSIPTSFKSLTNSFYRFEKRLSTKLKRKKIHKKIDQRLISPSG